jgi:hypothetical protein
MLVDPLFSCAGKRVKKFSFFIALLSFIHPPLFPPKAKRGMASVAMPG